MSHLTRRQFLEDSMLAAAAVAAAGAGTRVAGADDPPSKSANEKILHAVIGCRIRGRVHAREFAGQLGAEVTYVCDPDRSWPTNWRRRWRSSKAGGPRQCRTCARFSTTSRSIRFHRAPNHWHALAAIWAMQAGKDVYVEKPVSHNVSEGRRMVQVARKTGRICQGGHQYRSSGANAAAVEYMRQGKLGEVKLARSIVYGGRGSIGAPGTYEVPASVDYNLFLGPRRWSR